MIQLIVIPIILPIKIENIEDQYKVAMSITKTRSKIHKL